MALRVIAGSAGGIPLACPRTGDVRPTMEQVRGAIFSSLADAVPEARFLDLFAGAGTLGIEALSRGAQSVTFVERDRRTIECIRDNLEKTRLAAGADLICLDVFAALARPLASRRFDFVFADPPYTSADQSKDYAGQLIINEHLPTILSPGGLLILEKSPRQPLPAENGGWEIVRQKRYGTTEVIFLKRPPESN